MYQQRQSNTAVANNATGSGDTTYTKIFVGGLAWETQRDTLKRYFEQFGEILEAAVIVDKNTGRSKGYGFVTFTDPDSARRACRYQYPVIDGRRANCNVAAFGARNNYPTTPSRGMEKFRPSLRTMAPVPFQGPPTYFHPHIPQHTFPYSPYGYPYYLQDMYSMSVYNAYGGQHLPSYSNGFIASGSHEVYDCYPYAQHGDGSAIHNPKIIQNPYLYQQQYRPLGGLQVPTSASPSNTPTENPVTAPIAEARVPRTGSEQSSSA